MSFKTKFYEVHNFIDSGSSLKEDSVLASLVVYMQRICENNSANRLRMSLAFKVLAGPFERPLPPLNWMSLLPIAQQYVGLFQSSIWGLIVLIEF